MLKLKIFIIVLLLSAFANASFSEESEPVLTKFYWRLAIVQHSYKNDEGYALELVKLFNANPYVADSIKKFWDLKLESAGYYEYIERLKQQVELEFPEATTEQNFEKIEPEAEQWFLNYYYDNWDEINTMILNRMRQLGIRTKEEETPESEKLLVDSVSSKLDFDIKGVKRALAQGANPNWVSSEGRRTTLIGMVMGWSAARTVFVTKYPNNEKQTLEILKLLFDNGASLQYRDKEILYFPIVFNQVKIVEFFLQKGANPNGLLGGKTPIEVAEEAGNKQIVRVLMEQK